MDLVGDRNDWYGGQDKFSSGIPGDNYATHMVGSVGGWMDEWIDEDVHECVFLSRLHGCGIRNLDDQS